MSPGRPPSARRRRSELQQRCERIVNALELPSPFDVFAFLAMVARLRGRPIEVLAVSARPQAPCGLLASTGSADYILYAADTTALHQQHILLHEAAHLICGHHDDTPALSSAVQSLLPHLPPSVVQRVLGRSVYAEPQEQEAELVASLIRCRAARADERRPVAEPPGTRLESLLAAPSRRRG